MKTVVFFLAMLAVLPVYAEDEKKAEPKPLKEHVRIRAMHREAMVIRGRYNLPAQELDEECCKIAQRWANRMAADSWMRHGGGEQIIARGYATEKSCMAAWLRSAGHRAWLLSGKALCGWGCQKSRNGQWYWAGVFRSKKAPEPKPQESTDTNPEEKSCPGGSCRVVVRKRARYFQAWKK